MKVVVTDTWRNHAQPTVMPIAEALTPDVNFHENPHVGLIDDMRDLQTIVGSLLGMLVEKDVIQLDEARTIAKLHRYEMHIHEPGTYGED